MRHKITAAVPMTVMQIQLLVDHGWPQVEGTGQPSAVCQKTVRGTAFLHPRTFRHLHETCALRVSGLRNVVGEASSRT